MRGTVLQGSDVLVWNRTPAKADALARQGARLSDTPAAAAAGAEIVITMVSDPLALRAVTVGSSGIAAGVRSTAAVVEMSTGRFRRCVSVGIRATRGGGPLDAPVLGSVSAAESGTLTIFVGGPAPLVERWSPLPSALGTPVHVGPHGAGAAAKLVANFALFGVLGCWRSGSARSWAGPARRVDA